MESKKYESPEIQVISIEPDETLMGTGTGAGAGAGVGSMGVDFVPEG